MYKITAIVIKNYQAPINWTRFTDKKVSKEEAIKMLGKPSEFELKNFKCVRVNHD